MSPTEGIGGKIRRAREARHLRQKDLASLIKVSRSAVNAWETGRSHPKNRIGALEQVLRINLTDDGPPPVPRYDDPVLQYIWETPGLEEDIKLGLIAWVQTVREHHARQERRDGEPGPSPA